MSFTPAVNPRCSARPSSAPSKKKNSSEPSAGERLRAAILRCARCTALVQSRSQAVPGIGAVPADVAFVGIAPGRLGGDRTGLPFYGDRSGTLLRAMIYRAGIEHVFITNIVRCSPRDERGRNRAGDVIVFRMLWRPSHVGLVITRGVFIHCREGSDSCLGEYESPRWAHRVEGIYRYAG